MILIKITLYLVIWLVVFPLNLLAQKENELQEIFLLDKNDFNPYVEFVSDDIKDFFNPGAENPYPSSNLFDGYLKTCWVAGSAKTNKNSILYLKLPEKIDLNKIILNIFSGYGKSKSLYFANARPAKIKLTLFTAVYPVGFSTEVLSLYVMKKYPIDKTICLADTFGLQSFPLNLDKEELIKYQKYLMTQTKNFSGPGYTRFARYSLPESFSSSLILKLEIIDSYPGTKYDDVCISEVFFNDRFITPYPDRYNEVLNVYIEDDNTLLADYADKKGLVICKDTSAVFTYVDWPEESNWAILHYVLNDEVGEGSRIEEISSLIDLKNKKIVDYEFKKSTGRDLMFQILSKEDNGNVYLENETYKIELK